MAPPSPVQSETAREKATSKHLTLRLEWETDMQKNIQDLMQEILILKDVQIVIIKSDVKLWEIFICVEKGRAK